MVINELRNFIEDVLTYPSAKNIPFEEYRGPIKKRKYIALKGGKPKIDRLHSERW